MPSSGEQDQHAIFEARHLLHPHEMAGQNEGDGGSEKNQDLHQAREAIHDESAAESFDPSLRHGDDEHAREGESRQSQGVDDFHIAAFEEHAEHQQDHCRGRQDEFGPDYRQRQAVEQVGHQSFLHKAEAAPASPAVPAAPSPDRSDSTEAEKMSSTAAG